MTNKGKYGVDPHGVKFVSFEMPYEPDEEELTFEYENPNTQASGEVKVTNDTDVLGVIILFEPEA